MLVKWIQQLNCKLHQTHHFQIASIRAKDLSHVLKNSPTSIRNHSYTITTTFFRFCSVF